ncbi:hypothetical protein OL239_13450 [Arthrobacter sp. ATA002]|uniref:hypothetical protein n=1 Tax=Arthrobacter sp. ATA002 TaxID=2991715 RepID=UPI0022A7FD3A|nr:hypothetical protein [Arthrobacter sp. ATA002]WAP50947.1 hypothetical protein OL239_13450 [Arthrobacter sp. ATA002]
MDGTTPWIEDRREVPYLALPVVTDRASLGRDMPAVEDRLLSLVEYSDTDPYPIFWRYTSIDMAGTLQVDVGARLTGPAPISPGEAALSDVLPAGRYACLLHAGDPAEVPEATAGLLDWAEFQGLVFDRPGNDPDGWTCRLEEYLVDPAHVRDLRDWRIRLAVKLSDSGPQGFTGQVAH